jgi:hypothetical protein
MIIFLEIHSSSAVDGEVNTAIPEADNDLSQNQPSSTDPEADYNLSRNYS